MKEEEKTEKFGSKVEGFERFRTIVINRRINDSKIKLQKPIINRLKIIVKAQHFSSCGIKIIDNSAWYSSG